MQPFLQHLRTFLALLVILDATNGQDCSQYSFTLGISCESVNGVTEEKFPKEYGVQEGVECNSIPTPRVQNWRECYQTIKYKYFFVYEGPGKARLLSIKSNQVNNPHIFPEGEEKFLEEFWGKELAPGNSMKDTYRERVVDLCEQPVTYYTTFEVQVEGANGEPCIKKVDYTYYLRANEPGILPMQPYAPSLRPTSTPSLKPTLLEQQIQTESDGPTDKLPSPFPMPVPTQGEPGILPMQPHAPSLRPTSMPSLKPTLLGQQIQFESDGPTDKLPSPFPMPVPTQGPTLSSVTGPPTNTETNSPTNAIEFVDGVDLSPSLDCDLDISVTCTSTFESNTIDCNALPTPEDESDCEVLVVYNFTVEMNGPAGAKLTKISRQLGSTEEEFVKFLLGRELSMPFSFSALKHVPINLCQEEVYEVIFDVTAANVAAQCDKSGVYHLVIKPDPSMATALENDVPSHNPAQENMSAPFNGSRDPSPDLSPESGHIGNALGLLVEKGTETSSATLFGSSTCALVAGGISVLLFSALVI